MTSGILSVANLSSGATINLQVSVDPGVQLQDFSVSFAGAGGTIPYHKNFSTSGSAANSVVFIKDTTGRFADHTNIKIRPEELSLMSAGIYLVIIKDKNNSIIGLDKATFW